LKYNKHYYPFNDLLHYYHCFSPIDGEDSLNETLRCILDAYPDAVKNKTRYGKWYPLHQAALLCPLTAVQMVYEAYPKALYIFDKSGAPLHQAAHNRDGRVAAFLLAKYPGAIRIRNKEHGKLPLHLAAESQAFAAFAVLYNSFPAAVGLPFFHGRLILLIMFESKYYHALLTPMSPWDKVVRHALQLCPTALATVRGDGETVYRSSQMCRSKTNPHFLRLILRAAPQLDPEELRRLNYEDRRGALYLLLFAKFPVCEQKTIWQRLKEHGDRQLFKEIILFL
jgi:hypothetical protein